MTGYEQQLYARAEMLEDTTELARAVVSVLAGGQASGVDPAAVTSLAGAARALDPGADTAYEAGGPQDRRPGGGYRSDSDMLEAVADAEEDVQERLREVQQLAGRVTAALDAAEAALADARRALAGAHAMPTKNPCDGCHDQKQAAIMAAEAAVADAQEPIRICDAALDLLGPLTERLRRALVLLRQVPHDLGEVYELVYEFIRKGGKLPVPGRWIEGKSTRM